MKKIILIFCLSFFVFSLLTAQGIKDTLLIQKENKWNLGVYISPNYSYRKLIASDLPSSRQYINYLNSLELPRWKYGYGFSIKYKINKKLYFNTGLSFYHMRYESKLLDSLSFEPIGNAGQQAIAFNCKYNYKYSIISIPLCFEYLFTKQQGLSYGIGAGIDIYDYSNYIYSIASVKNSKVIYSEKLIASHRLRFLGNVFLEMNYSFPGNKILLHFDPGFIYTTLNDLELRPLSITDHLYSFEFKVGISLKINSK